MDKREIRNKCISTMKKNGYSLIQHTWRCYKNDQVAMFKVVSNDTGAVFEIYVDFENKYATKQMLGAIFVHKVRNIDWMFFD